MMPTPAELEHKIRELKGLVLLVAAAALAAGFVAGVALS